MEALSKVQPWHQQDDAKYVGGVLQSHGESTW
jgi:hypothetical protein